MYLPIVLDVLLVVFVFVCLLLILVVLMQRSKQDGLGAAFGGGLTETVFGAQTSSILIRFTSWLIALFFILAVALAYLYGKQNRTALTPLESRLHPAAAVAPAAPAPPGAQIVPAPAPTEAPAPTAPQPAAQPAH